MKKQKRINLDSLGNKYYGPDSSGQSETFDTFFLRILSMTLNDHLAMYSTDDLAQIFNCSSRHIRRLVFRGDFPRPVKIGRLSRWPRPTVEHWFTEKVGLPDMQGELAK